MVELGAADLRRREKTGLARPSDDVHAVAAILNVIALGPVLLPHHLEHALGGETLERWRAAAAELLRSALYPESNST
jgi:hypothetical protein